jgi:2-oxoglutarate dehydrogenase E2 component (dihydrolipoamide succinyltransferase)
MQVEVIMPKMGESIQEGTILRWWKKEGESIKKDETILEISTDKVDSEIPSPETGILINILTNERETVPVGTVIAYIETDKMNDSVATGSNRNSFSQKADKENIQLQSSMPVHKSRQIGSRFYSPLVKTIATKEGINKNDLDSITGSGRGGRVTKYDIMNYIKQRPNDTNELGAWRKFGGNRSVDLTELTQKYPLPEYRVVKMDNIQRKMAEHMARSVATSPQVTIVDEIDMTSIVGNRLRILEQFEKQEGFKLTYTHFFAYAVVNALKEFSIVNSSIEGDAIIYKNFINLGIAVATTNGLVVPVVRSADRMEFKDLAQAVNNVAIRARDKKLLTEDTVNGTFSITNYGVFGSIIGTPIINQPQNAILGIGVIKKRPMVIQEDTDHPSIAIRSMVYLTLTFDHRIIDGAIGGQFLSRVKWYLENFDFQVVKNGIRS